MPVDMSGVLLRGTTLKNSGRIAGLVVYTGGESRIQMNAAPPPRKRGARALLTMPLPLTRPHCCGWPPAACGGASALLGTECFALACHWGGRVG